MALGDRLMKKVTGKSGSARAMRADDAAAAAVDAGLRSHASNVSALSSSSSTASGSDSHTMSYHGGYDHWQPPAPAPQPRELPRAVHMGHAPPTKAPPSEAPSSNQQHRATPEILQKGYLLVKKGLLKGYEKRFYFLTAQSPDLYCCRDELHFAEWLASGLPVRKLPGMARQQEAALPSLVCTVLRADRAGDNSAFDRAIAVIASGDAKCTAVKYLAPTPDACEDWICSLHQVQIARRPGATGANGSATGSATGAGSRRERGDNGSFAASDLASHTPASSHGGRTPSYAPQPQPQPHPSGRATPASASASGYGTPHSGSGGTSSRHSDVSDSPSRHSSRHQAPPPASSTSSTRSGATSTATAAAAGNVLLFVPAAGSAISISDSKLQHARQEMDALVAAGAKRPLRSGLDDAKTTRWRYGPPEYVLSDLEYIKGKTRDADSTPLESYAEACCQTFLMEATHKAAYAEWTSVRHEYFFLQVNDGDKIAGHALKENDLFGLLYLDGSAVDMDGDERKDPRAALAEAFPQGFPMEVLDVYTQPPQCHFAWRHWGRFTGRYRGVRGRGELVEVRGFGQMHIDGGKLMSLRLFFKQRDLFDQLNKAAVASTSRAKPTPAGTRAARQPTAGSRSDAGLAPAPTPTATATATTKSQPQPQPQVPQPQPRAARPDKLADFIDDFGDFNITAASVAGARAVAASRTHSSPASRDGSTTVSSSSSSPPAAEAAPPPQSQAAKRAQLYQQFMPQGA